MKARIAAAFLVLAVPALGQPAPDPGALQRERQAGMAAAMADAQRGDTAKALDELEHARQLAVRGGTRRTKAQPCCIRVW